MRPRIILLLSFLVLCSLISRSEAKLQQHSIVEEDEDEDEDDWEDDDDDDENYRSKPEVDDEGRIYKNPRNSPSALCPRDEEQAEMQGQKCLRKCSTDEDCKSKKKKCRCDGICGMSCIKPERECPDLEEIKHGAMRVTGRFFGDKAHYTCDADFYSVGLLERTCRADGRWSGSKPSCKNDSKTFCLEPPKIKNTRHNALVEQTSFDLDSMVQYFCDHGYVTAGFPKAKCLMMDGAASWFGPDIACEPQSCGTPADIANGWHAGECYTYDCRVSYHCADTYELVGRAEKLCMADGSWTPKELPQCVQVTQVQCSAPENPKHGNAVFTSVGYNSIVSYECKHGYTIVGATTRRCSADRRWTGQTPMCKEINCGSPGTLYNGWIDNIEAGTGLGASLIFRCNEHMKLEGNTSSVCQIDGKWRYPLPQCLAPCVVPQIGNGHVIVANNDTDHINNVSVVEHGERLLVKCVQDYEFAANSTPVVCNNGTWSIVPSCSPARCKQMPKAPKNGMVIAPKTDHGMKAVFKCKDGFELVGGGPFNLSFSVECSFGNWTGDIPSCIEVYCPFPGFVKNGKVLLVGNMGVYDYRPYVKKVVNNKQIMYDCDKGYYLSEGPPGATCISGHWSPRELPICALGQHPRIRWNRRRRSVQEEGRNQTVAAAYRKFVDFFRKVGKKLLHLETKKNSTSLKNVTQEVESGNVTLQNTIKNRTSHGGRSRTRDEKMVDFLKVVYRKLQRIDTKHSDNHTNVTMHDLLNVISKNFFRVDLSQPRKNSTAKTRDSFEVRNQREFTKLKREFERIVRFYNKTLRWYEKQSRKESRKRNQTRVEKGKKKDKKKHKVSSTYKGFYEFINDYVNEKLSMLETQNATEELIKKMKIDKMTVRNGTCFTIEEIYTYFKHIIENNLKSTKVPEQITTEIPSILSTEKSTNLSSSNSSYSNEIPTVETKSDLPKHRSRRIRNVSNRAYMLMSSSNLQDVPKGVWWPKLPRRTENREKRFLPLTQLDNQSKSKQVKDLYLGAYEGDYRKDVKRSIFPSDNRMSSPVLGKFSTETKNK